MEYPDVMVDIETTGTDPSHSGILQIAAVAFNVDTGQVCPDIFNMSLSVPPGRFWDEGTREFWSKHKEVLAKIRASAQPPAYVMSTLREWVLRNAGREARLWGKPISFEAPLLESYFRQFELTNPFGFRLVRDQRTWVASKLGPETDVFAWEKSRPMIGAAHDAVFDTLHQVKLVLEATHGTR